jgi:hypothetical protein
MAADWTYARRKRLKMPTTPLPPTPAAVVEYFHRRRRAIAEFSPDDILHNERLWCDEICGQPESALDPAPIITREPAASLDDPFADKTKFGPVGQFTKCRGCALTFESRGLQLCPDCYAVLGDKVERKIPSAADRPVKKRPCQQCGGDMPAYHSDGRRVRTSARFCSESCRQRYAFVRAKQPPQPALAEGQISVSRNEGTRGVGGSASRNAESQPAPRRCEGCRHQFQPTRKDTKFCSAACKQRAYRSGKLVSGLALAAE